MKLPKFNDIERLSYSGNHIIIDANNKRYLINTDSNCISKGAFFHYDYAGHYMYCVKNIPSDLLLAVARCKHEKTRSILKKLLKEIL